MDIQLSQRAQQVKPSPTLAMNAKAKKMKAAGGDIISLGVGEPDFDTPIHIKEAAINAINAGVTKYTAVDGTPELKNAIINKLANDNALTYTPEQILVSTGAKQSLYNLTQALLNPGDEAIIPAPYWVSYPDMCILAGATPITLNTSFSQQFKISPEQLRNAITPNTKLVFFNSPSNPSGMVYSHEELAAIGDVLKEYPQIMVVTDDIYEHIIWTRQPFANIVNACPELYDRTVVVNGVSKAYSMTGWRIGYAAGPAALIAGMKKIQSQSTSNPNSIAQVAAQAALEGDQSCVQDMVKEFKARHDYVVGALNDLPGIQCHQGHGTFYAFADCSEAIANLSGIEDDLAFAEHLLAKTGIAAVPGSAFGCPGCLRLSFAVSMEVLHDAMRRLKTIL